MAATDAGTKVSLPRAENAHLNQEATAAKPEKAAKTGTEPTRQEKQPPQLARRGSTSRDGVAAAAPPRRWTGHARAPRRRRLPPHPTHSVVSGGPVRQAAGESCAFGPDGRHWIPPQAMATEGTASGPSTADDGPPSAADCRRRRSAAVGDGPPTPHTADESCAFEVEGRRRGLSVATTAKGTAFGAAQAAANVKGGAVGRGGGHRRRRLLCQVWSRGGERGTRKPSVVV